MTSEKMYLRFLLVILISIGVVSALFGTGILSYAISYTLPQYGWPDALIQFAESGMAFVFAIFAFGFSVCGWRET